ncbi:KIAA1468-like protein [Hibiscus syriacus]|uniref:KIAA1468-like protein n=1 Tax=Hibiscus syriacus TaxID=106335 RepID=A0A6A3CMF5_HIBSY|nr:KIAA1468-like protein [Hibiscus syriacus]
MDVDRSSRCNFVVNFLLEENYLLTAFELLHELLEEGRDAQAIRLKEFFSDPSHFPVDQISRYSSLGVADPQSLLEEKEAIEEKLALSDYELRLAQEDITKLKTELQRKSALPQDKLSDSSASNNENHALDLEVNRQKRDAPLSTLGLLKAKERKDLNCAVKEYLLIGGYRLTAMTFCEEVTDQNLDVWENSPASVPDALRHYYYQYLSSSTEAAEEKISMIRENESLQKANERLKYEKELLVKNKDLAEGQINALTKSLVATQKDLTDKENMIQDVKCAWEHQRKELNDCRDEITSLKKHVDRSSSVQDPVASTSSVDSAQPQTFENYKEEIKALQKEIERLKAEERNIPNLGDSSCVEKESTYTEEKVVEMDENKTLITHSIEQAGPLDSNALSPPVPTFDNSTHKPEEKLAEPVVNPSSTSDGFLSGGILSQQNEKPPSEQNRLHPKPKTPSTGPTPENMGLGTIQILADALPKIVPYVLINHREELLPLIMCAIERHPDNATRDSLTHTLFNLIKRPDEQQRRIIMDACVSLAKNVGEVRTEIELLPQCWEQINHVYEERRLLVAQSCGELAEFVRPEIRDSLILSIVQQLIEDPATVVREAAVRNLALLLPLFPHMDKYFQRCPPVSGVEGSVESHLRTLGERERWNLDILLRILVDLLPYVHQKAIETCPFSSVSESNGTIFSSSVLEMYAGGHVEWPAFEWMHVNCFSGLIQLACVLPQKEDSLRNRITKFLLAVSERFGESYSTHIMIPVFLIAVGDTADLTFFPTYIHSRINGLKPRVAVAERLATLGILPLLLAGVLGSPGKRQQLADYLRKLLVEGVAKQNHSPTYNNDIVNAVRFLCTFEEHLSLIFDILWEMVVSSNIELKIGAANILKAIVTYVTAKVASTHVLPALITLGSDQNVNVKNASIDAFGAVAQHFKNDMIVDKIRVQMDAFLEEGSHETTMAVIFQLSSMPVFATDMMSRRQRANAFCEAICAVDTTGLLLLSTRLLILGLWDRVPRGAIHNLEVFTEAALNLALVASYYPTSPLPHYIWELLPFLTKALGQSSFTASDNNTLTVFNLTTGAKSLGFEFWQVTCSSEQCGESPSTNHPSCYKLVNSRLKDRNSFDLQTDLPNFTVLEHLGNIKKISANSIRDFLLPAIQNLLRDPDALDPAHKEALEIILKERSGGTFDALSKVMGAHIGIASSMTSFFGEGGLLGKKESTASTSPVGSPAPGAQSLAPEDTRFMRIMRVTDRLRGKAKNQDETHLQNH